MKLHTDQSLHVEASHDFKSQSFSIKASAAAFNILSSALYTDKISAVIRELSCNAYDAHVAAERNGLVGQSKVPFDVTLPSQMSPVFKIRDYGTGLSEADVMHLYTTYFESSKNDSNDFIGALGLGSKSPFSIVSSFLVVSFFEGKKSVYTAIINEEGFPSIVLLHSEDTDEPNGMEINVTVSESDIWSFHSRATNIYQFFEIKPNFLGSVTPKINVVEYECEFDSWAISKYGILNDPVALQGQVAYSVPLEAVEGRISNDAYNLLSDIDYRFVFKFNIGDVEPQASRESLSFTSKTIAAIQRVLDEALQDIAKSCEERISSVESYIDAITIYNNFKSYEQKVSPRYWNGLDVSVGHIETREHRVAKRYKITDALNNDIYKYKIDKKPGFSIISTNGRGFGSSFIELQDLAKEDATLPDFPLEKTFCLTQTIKQHYVGQIIVVLNDAKTPQYKLKSFMFKNITSEDDSMFSHNSMLVVFPHNKQKDLEVFKNVLQIQDHQLTSAWQIEEEQKEKPKKTCRIFRPKCIRYSRYGAMDELNTTSRFSTVDIEAETLEAINYYVVTKGGAYSFVHPFEQKQTCDATHLNDIMQTLIGAKLFSETDKIACVTSQNEAELKSKAPHIRPLSDIFLINKTPSKEQAVAIKHLMHYNKAREFRGHSPDDSVAKFLEMIRAKTSVVALKEYANITLQSLQDSIRDIEKIEDLKYQSYLKNTIKYLEDHYPKLKSDIKTENNLLKVSDFVKRNFPIYNIVINVMHYWSSEVQLTTLRYVEQDWKTVAILPEVIEDLTKGQYLAVA